jgi:hypothetical protein
VIPVTGLISREGEPDTTVSIHFCSGRTIHNDTLERRLKTPEDEDEETQLGWQLVLLPTPLRALLQLRVHLILYAPACAHS